ncbi:MAG TPA: hypothetical protein PKN96_12165 [Flavobacterium sp.]|nr:hypothetical protein [Flavobacterium sp.]
MLPAYELLFYLSFEYLNSNPKYLKISFYKVYNWLFLAFVTLIVLVRLNLYDFSAAVDYHINTVEHLSFAFAICLTLSVYMQLFDIAPNRKLLKFIIVFIIFNGLGFFNEFFENIFQQRPFFSIEGNDIKDLIVNLIGSSSFIIISMINAKDKKKFD